MVTISLPPEVESRLQVEASRHGLPKEEYARNLIVEHLPPTGEGSSLAALLAQWEQEDATTDAAEIARRNQEVEEFKAAMNRNRLEMEGPESRKLFP